MWLLDELKKRKHSTAKAIVYEDSVISYKELWERSEKIANYIESKSNNLNPILIYGNKENDIIAVMIAALKTGHAYVPVDITFPIERLEKIATITGTEMIFNFSDLKLDSKYGIDKDKISKILDAKDFHEISEDRYVKDEDTCYILFTSGSTGDPKGVQINKKNIMNFTDWFKNQAIIEEGKMVLNQVSYSFDVSVIQLYLYLASGVTLFSVDKSMISDFGKLFENLRKSNIASWVSTPAFIEMCAIYDDFNSQLLPDLEKVILAGEVLTKKLVKKLWNKFEGLEIINGYGPTEATVLLSACTICKDMVMDDENELPIGKLISDAEFYLEKDGKRVLDGPGELIISSKNVSIGYYKKPEITAKNFFTKNNKRFYKTGDLVYVKNGYLYYIGRVDFQIKLNGYRIELGDIQENVNKISFINNNIVVPVYRDGRVAYIAAFVVLSNKLELSNAKISIKIRKELRELIPSYMVPKKIVILEEFPLNTNGKIDRKKLMEDYL